MLLVVECHYRMLKIFFTSKSTNMAREGVTNRPKKKISNFKNADPSSKRSSSRRVRGWKSLELSSRKHRRNARRSIELRTISGKLHEAGQKVDPSLALGGKVRVHTATAGGSNDYHC